MWSTIVLIVLLVILCYRKFFYPNGQPWIQRGRFKRDVWVPEDIPLEYTKNVPLDITKWSIKPSSILSQDIASYPVEKFKGNLQNVINKPPTEASPSTAFQWKSYLTPNSPVENWVLNRSQPIIQTINNEYTAGLPPSELIIRMSTNPWSFHSHFDCLNNYAVQIYGQKDILLWKLQGWGVTQQKELLRKLSQLNNAEAIKLLKINNIPYKRWQTQPGDLFYIPQGWYHKIESINTTPLSILLNYNTHSNYKKQCNNVFKQLWNKQTSKCINNRCL